MTGIMSPINKILSTHLDYYTLWESEHPQSIIIIPTWMLFFFKKKKDCSLFLSFSKAMDPLINHNPSHNNVQLFLNFHFSKNNSHVDWENRRIIHRFGKIQLLISFIMIFVLLVRTKHSKRLDSRLLHPWMKTSFYLTLPNSGLLYMVWSSPN